MRTTSKPIGIFYPYESYTNPLFSKLISKGIPFRQLDPASHIYYPLEHRIPFSLLLNDLSNPFDIDHDHSFDTKPLSYIRHLEETNPGFAQSRLINGSRVTEIFGSRSRQLTVFSSLSFSFPKTFVVGAAEQLFAAADELNFPLIIKQDLAFGHISSVYVESLFALQEGIAQGKISLRENSTVLVQEYIRPKGNHVVRVETLNGQVTEAHKLYISWDDASTAVKDRAEFHVLLPEIAQRIEKIVRAARVESGSVEYLIDAATNKINFLSIHPHTYEISTKGGNLELATAENISGYIEYRLLKGREIELAL